VPNFFLAEDLARFEPAPLTEPAQGEPFRLGFVGYLIPEKGIDVLLEAGWRLSRETAVEITLVGEASVRSAELLERFRALQDATFTLLTPGRLDLDGLLTEMRTQHAFVFLSRFHGEGHSNAVTEAMALALPIVCSSNGFLADVVTPECGVVVGDATDVEEVVDVLRGLRRDWPSLRAMGRAARRRIETAFTDGVALAPTAEVYRAGSAARRAA
jgi:glycosyltransferase involved in cell wall biosynthesis